MIRICFLLGLFALTGCGDDDPVATPEPPPVPLEPFFPADYATTYLEVRNCRPSSEHDLARVRVLADPQAAPIYTTREGELQVGAVLVKEEYDGSDTECAGPLTQWTAIRRLATGSAPDMLDWEWQRVRTTRDVMTQNETRCSNCHSSCEAPSGFANTCAVP